MSASETNPVSDTDLSSRNSIIGSIAVSVAFVMELTLVPLVLPQIQQKLELDISALAWVFNSYGIAVALGVLVGGILGDMLGIRKVFRIGVLLFALGALVVALAGDFQTVIAGRAIQGFGGGVFSPLVPLLLTRAVPSKPGKILMIWGSVVGYVAAFAPIALGQMLSTFGWESAFMLFSVVSFLALLINGRMKENANMGVFDAPPRFDRLLQARELWLVYVYIFCTYGCITFYLFRMPVWLSNKGYELTDIGLILSVLWLSFSILGTFLRNQVDGSNVRSMMFFAPLIIAVSFPVAYFFDSFTAFLLSAALVGMGFACSNSPSTQMVLRFAPKGMNAISASLDITFARLGGVMTISFLAQLQFNLSILFMIGLSVAAVACFLIFSRSADRLANEPF